MQLYWDDENKVAKNKNSYGCVPMYQCEEGLCIESWWVDSGKTIALEFAYTQEQKVSGKVYLLRKLYFERYNVQPHFLRSVSFPKNIYEEYVNQMKEKQSE